MDTYAKQSAAIVKELAQRALEELMEDLYSCLHKATNCPKDEKTRQFVMKIVALALYDYRPKHINSRYRGESMHRPPRDEFLGLVALVQKRLPYDELNALYTTDQDMLKCLMEELPSYDDLLVENWDPIR